MDFHCRNRLWTTKWFCAASSYIRCLDWNETRIVCDRVKKWAPPHFIFFLCENIVVIHCWCKSREIGIWVKKRKEKKKTPHPPKKTKQKNKKRPTQTPAPTPTLLTPVGSRWLVVVAGESEDRGQSFQLSPSKIYCIIGNTGAVSFKRR